MSQLFGKGTIKSHIEVLAGFDDSKIEIIKRLHQDRKNKLLDDESRYEQTFNQIFFGELLEYQDMINRIPKGGVLGSGIADLTIGDFADGKYEPENVQVVCELKGAKTNLTKKQFGHGGLSPVGQGFAYKTGLKNCKRLIVSNFYEIRLYRDNTTDFEIRNLDELLDPKDNYFNLRKLYLLLHRDNLLTGKTEKLLSHFREEQQKITKKFYQEYKELRIRLIKDIRKNNPNLSVTTSVEKAQKIIDRLIFIFFCEDKGLLPDKKLKEGIVRAGEFDISPREMTKKFFTGVDSGSEKLGIPDGYNGGLFKEDSILNSLRISDDICNDFVGLTNYNFDDDISVNILGHIFEQSISDLEEIKEDLIGRETQDNSKGRRKKDGIFYTPEYIVDYIVQNSVMKYLNEKEDECLSEVSTIDEKTGERRRKKNIENPEQKAYLKYQQILQNIKVLDPACGSGAFLVRVFDVLLEENKRVGSILNSLFDEAEIYKNILTYNIYGVDLNEESVEITKLSLWLKSAQKGKKLNNLDANIKCGNSLIDDKTITDKALDREKEFPQVLSTFTPTSKGIVTKKTVNGKELKSITGLDDEMFGFDIVVGNPPYVDSESMTKNYLKDREYINSKYKTAKGNRDMFVIFVEKGFSVLKKGGYVSYILPNKLLGADYAFTIRDYINNNGTLENIIDLSKDNVFSDANVYPIIFLISKSIKSNSLLVGNNTNGINYHKHKFDRSNNNRTLYLNKGKNIIDKLILNNTKIKDDFLIFSAATVSEAYELAEKISENNVGYKLVNTGTIDPWIFLWGKNIFNYIKKTYLCPTVSKTDIKTKDWYDKAKLVIAGMSKVFECGFDESNQYLPTKSTTIITSQNTELLKYLMCYLHSKLANYLFQSMNSTNQMAGGYMNFNANNIGEIPLIVTKNLKPFIERADKMLSLNKELHELTDKFFHRIQDNLKIEKITNKLRSFYEGEFKDFLDELKKQKISLSLSEQDDREPYFKEYKEKILLLKGEIERTDKEIDEMVFDLYGLSEEERKVVLGG